MKRRSPTAVAMAKRHPRPQRMRHRAARRPNDHRNKQIEVD
jgi:hypothetical protein